MISSPDCYKIYLAAKLHFTTDTYNGWDHKWKVHTNELSVPKHFRYLAGRFRDKQEAAHFFIACFAYGANVFDPQASRDAYKKWMKHREMMTQLIIDDISYHGNSVLELRKFLTTASSGVINIETAVAINRHFGYSKDPVWENYFAYERLRRIIVKLDRFIQYNEEKVTKEIESLMYVT